MERPELRPINPPKGVVMFQMRWSVSEYFEQFGLTGIHEGLVESANYAPESIEVPGTLLEFSPSRLSVRVTRLGLQAEEINRIGVLARQIERTSAKLSSIPKALTVINELAKLLVVSGTEDGTLSARTYEAAVESLAQAALADISALGSLKNRLESGVEGLNEKLVSDAGEAAGLGVSLIRYDTRSIRDGVFSPKRYIAQLPKAETATS